MKKLLRNLGVPAVALAGMLALFSPASADARVRFGVEIGVPPYPVYAPPYPYYGPYYSYPYGYTYGGLYPGIGYGYHYDHHFNGRGRFGYRHGR
jgi:hypothetical protein